MKSHLKGLLKKEWYLLRGDYIRLIAEFVLPIILGLLLTGVDKLELREPHGGGSFLHFGNASGSNGSGSFQHEDCRNFTFSNCDFVNSTEKVKKWIGIIAKEGEDSKKFKDLLNVIINDKRNESHKIPFKIFESEKALLSFASSSNPDSQPHLRHSLCLGIKFAKENDDYHYKLFLDDQLFSFKQAIYDELELYVLD